ncbi:FeS assembly protein SufD [Oleispira antarctica RB-8]|uniref:FeS assembly protein SufD n=1 Tax=Oleispira antarctica RB-8 TaxID=698738 RepID=R4YPV2_OLEAN|nr:FeS assembly protein SufD [Oleispira antarctica RB-8]
MTDFHNGLLAVANTKSNAENELFAALNKSGSESFLQQEIPTRKTEAWKFTSLYNFTSNEEGYGRLAETHNAAGLDGITTIPALNAQRLVFVNGQYSEELSSNESVNNVVRFSQANEAQQAIIADNLGTAIEQEKHLFAALNNATTTDGVLVHVGKNEQLKTNIQITHITTAQAKPFTVPVRLLIVLETGAQATVVEHFASNNDEQNCFVNAITEAKVGANAHLNHYRLQLMQEGSIQIGGVHVDLDRDANYDSFQLGLGAKIVRNDINVNHNVGGSHCELVGVYLPQNKQLIDFHSNIEHKIANCTTNEVFRGIMADKSKAVFNGRIHIHPDAQKTLAQLSNKNLLLSNDTTINTKPELEIYADDVRCAHGATIAQLDEQARFYLRSRGISAAEADVMLSFGFINELLENLKLDAVRDLIRPILAKRFGRDEELMKHLG